ncbi:hypothetical protein [Paenibacillus sp. O199]|uniref:hypothetical protein n=1 Tax=Paenibacillus sp. O199 TaxID=1643925 RepID=UPI0007BFEA3C|nr:hypothetical protein [Paenibacillus sp. O199]
MNEKDFKDICDRAIEEFNSRLSFDVRENFVTAAQETYMRMSIMEYHKELLKRGYIIEPSSN